MKKSYNKPTSKRLRELAAIAHSRELERELKKLYDQFRDWQAQKTDAFQLNDNIHQFHQKAAKEIWKRYRDNDYEDIQVVRAMKLGLLTEEEVGKKLLEQLAPLVSYWQHDAKTGEL